MGAKRTFRIAVVHSYERNYHDAGRYRHLLEKGLKSNGLDFELREYFLDCEELDYYLELARASYFIDDLTAWGADAVAVFNNQATYSLLKCDNPKLDRLPVVFSGVHAPDSTLIRRHPNVTGYVDIPDYPRTLGMIEQMMGKSRIVVMSGLGMIHLNEWKNLTQQCGGTEIRLYEGDPEQHLNSHRTVRQGVYDGSKEVFDNERIDTTVVMRLMCETLPLRIIQLAGRGAHTYFLLNNRTFSSLDAANFFNHPSFAVINEGFGSRDNMLGGYFAPLETQIGQMAEGICLRLRGDVPEQQMIQSPKRYVINWHVMQRYGISSERLLPEYEVMYVPFGVRYRYYLIGGGILGALVILFVIVYLRQSLVRERARKREALLNLRYEHETFKLAIEGGTTYVWRKSERGLRFDDHFYRLIGYTDKYMSQEQIIGYIHPDDRDRFRESFLQERSADCKQQYRCDFGGEYRWWEFRYNYLTTDRHESVVTGLLQNVQDVKDHEAELIEARMLAEKAELKQSFINNMSHEIRTPLNAIVGFSNLLVENPGLSEDEKREFIEQINRNNSLLLQLINDILELSRFDAKSVSFSLHDEDVRTLLTAYHHSLCVQVKPTLDFRCDFPAEDACVRVDAMRLQQVIGNLVTNADKFTREGYIAVGYRICREQQEVRIFVEDSGIGIPAEEQKMIFSRFYKRNEFAQGTGLGLSICQSIVERLGGRIEVESREGEGSRFTVILPVIR